jgi:hypothetical protein
VREPRAERGDVEDDRSGEGSQLRMRGDGSAHRAELDGCGADEDRRGQGEIERGARNQGPTRRQREQAERALWDWYLEWGGIARVCITDRRLLRALGFLSPGRPGRSVGDDAGAAESTPPSPLPAAAPVPQLTEGSQPGLALVRSEEGSRVA